MQEAPSGADQTYSIPVQLVPDHVFMDQELLRGLMLVSALVEFQAVWTVTGTGVEAAWATIARAPTARAVKGCMTGLLVFLAAA